ncbi:MAG: hypothetical protein V9E96_09230 [Chitinophagaceae bacterium]|jgi:hypothetical protein
MKTLSLKLEDHIFNDAEAITTDLKIARNRYINEAVNLFNQFNKRKMLKAQLLKESAISSKDSMDVLQQFEQLIDAD